MEQCLEALGGRGEEPISDDKRLNDEAIEQLGASRG